MTLRRKYLDEELLVDALKERSRSWEPDNWQFPGVRQSVQDFAEGYHQALMDLWRDIEEGNHI